MKIVLDTNVLVSAILHPHSIPAKVLDLVVAQQVTFAFDHRIFAEYQIVLSRPEFSFPHDQISDLLELLWRIGENLVPGALQLNLPDPDDRMFLVGSGGGSSRTGLPPALEVAVSAVANALVTGNLKHFPANQRHGVRVLSPREWMEVWASESPI